MEKLDKIWDAVLERFTNPLLFAFAMAWAVFNYRFLVVLFSDKPYQERFNYIETVLYPIASDPINRLFIWPITSAVAYVFVLPFFSLAATAVSAWWDNKHHALDLWVRKEAVLSEKQATTLKNETDAAIAVALAATHAAEGQGKVDAEIFQTTFGRPVALLRRTVLDHLRQEAKAWTGQIIKAYGPPPSGQVVDLEDAEKRLFLHQYGVPQSWLEPARHLNRTLPFKVTDWAGKAPGNFEAAWDTLLKLHALGLVTYQWVGSTLTFQLALGHTSGVLDAAWSAPPPSP